MKITISKTMMIFGVVVCACFAMLIAISWSALLKLEVNGQVYKEIVTGKDLIGDILPPPEYIIEAYLEANLAARNPSELEAHTARLVKLRKDYADRHEYWAASALPPAIKTQLIETSDRDVQAFWRKLDDALLPAIKAADAGRTTAALDDLSKIYESHRHTIDAIVAAATTANDDYEVQAKTLVDRYTLVLIVGSVTVFGVILAGLLLIARRLTRPLGSMTGHMAAMAAGRFSETAPCLGRADELGDMAAAMETFRAALVEKEQLEAAAFATRRQAEAERVRSEAERARVEQQQTFVVTTLAKGLGALAAGDLVLRLDDRFAVEYDQLRLDFNAAMETLQRSMVTVTSSASTIHIGTAEISAAAADLSRRTEQQAAALEETAAALDQITTTVKRMSVGVAEVRSVVSAAKADAEQSGNVVGRAVTAMNAIASSSQEISQIIGVIDEIAFQTNLLALNAGVEAARAGEAGRGFAVVASEVRALAQRSAEAAKDIKRLISTSREQVEQGVEFVGETGKVLDRVVSQIVDITGIVSDIAVSAQEQASGLDEVNTAVNQMDQVTQNNAAMVEQSTAASKNLAHEAEELARLIGQFRTGMDTRTRSQPRHAPATSVRVLKTTGGGGAVRKSEPLPAEGWDEF